MTRDYEWDVELMAGAEPDADILDHRFCESYAEARTVSQSEPLSRIVLVMTDDDGRGWAYLKDGALPEHFEQPNARGEYESMGVRVPQRFHREVMKGR